MPRTERADVRLRADAARNRQSLIDAAHAVYGQRGLDAPLDDIARYAGVGNATLYRHFPTRCALASAVFADTLHRVLDAAHEALRNPDPWAGFAAHVKFLCRLQATDRGLADLLTTEVAGAPELEDLRHRTHAAFARLARRARDSGQLRPDFVPQDILVLLIANAGLVHRTAQSAPNAWDRFTDLALDGLRAPAHPRHIAHPPTRQLMRQVMQNRGQDLGYN
jgi:AcrR family transcriptional regulator